MLTKPFWYLAFAAMMLTITHQCLTAEEQIGGESKGVPQILLGLVHAPEVHKELNLSAQQIESLEAVLQKVDEKWFPARVLPPDQQYTVTQELESQVWNWFRKTTSSSQQQRLQQLEYWALGNRMLLRDDIAMQIDLQSAQQQKLITLARATDAAKTSLSQTQFGDPQIQSLQQRMEKAIKAEQDGMKKVVRSEQLAKLKPLLGDPFDASRLKRIYAMAPEFVSVDNWINSSPLTMRELRGKVVLVHFYAFQCHNCHANFNIYRRWHNELAKKGVVVVGIQTPETPSERDPNAVQAAARERDLSFPIMIDLESKNWKAWGNTMWPCVYVVDKHGYIRMWWQGELNWKGATGDKSIEKEVDSLLDET